MFFLWRGLGWRGSWFDWVVAWVLVPKVDRDSLVVCAISEVCGLRKFRFMFLAVEAIESVV